MPTINPFTKKISIPDLISPGQSVGAHLAAKLDSFFSDERTLTDELCDMLCIWLTSPHTSRIIVPSPYVFDLFLTKTTPNEEIEIGADLELVVSSPLGKKRCLFQAKVLDPTSRKLRCDSTRGWEKLRTQLANAKKSAGDLSFLLIYVPRRMLNGRYYGFRTYEQGYLSNPLNNKKEAYYGVTVIPVNLLIDGYDQWISNVDKVKHDGNGGFQHGIALWKFLLELLLCKRGVWIGSPERMDESEITSFRRLTMTAKGVDESQWQFIQEVSEQFLSDDFNHGAE